MGRFSRLRQAREAAGRRENEDDLAKELNIILRTTHYEDHDHFRRAVSRCVQRVPVCYLPTLLGGEPRRISTRLGIEIPSDAESPRPRRKRRVTEARLLQLQRARERRHAR